MDNQSSQSDQTGKKPFKLTFMKKLIIVVGLIIFVNGVIAIIREQFPAANPQSPTQRPSHMLPSLQISQPPSPTKQMLTPQQSPQISPSPDGTVVERTNQIIPTRVMEP